MLLLSYSIIDVQIHPPLIILPFCHFSDDFIRFRQFEPLRKVAKSVRKKNVPPSFRARLYSTLFLRRQSCIIEDLSVHYRSITPMLRNLDRLSNRRSSPFGATNRTPRFTWSLPFFPFSFPSSSCFIRRNKHHRSRIFLDSRGQFLFQYLERAFFEPIIDQNTTSTYKLASTNCTSFRSNQFISHAGTVTRRRKRGTSVRSIEAFQTNRSDTFIRNDSGGWIVLL